MVNHHLSGRLSISGWTDESRWHSWKVIVAAILEGQNPRYEQTRVWGESGVGMMWTNYMVLLGVPNYFVDGDTQQLPYFWAGVTPPNSSIPYTLTEGFGWNCNFASVWKTFMKRTLSLWRGSYDLFHSRLACWARQGIHMDQGWTKVRWLEWRANPWFTPTGKKGAFVPPVLAMWLLVS